MCLGLELNCAYWFSKSQSGQCISKDAACVYNQITVVQILSATAPLLVWYLLIEANILCSFPISFITQGNKWGCARPWVGWANSWVLMSTHLMTSRWHPQWDLIGDIQINNHSGSQRCVSHVREDWKALSCVQHPLETNSHFHLCRVN